MLGNEKIKFVVMVILLSIACFLTYYFHAILKSHILFTHYFYIPIVLASIWWKRKGLIVAMFFMAPLEKVWVNNATHHKNLWVNSGIRSFPIQ